MYICKQCNKEFDDYITIMTTYEDYYGISDGRSTPLMLMVCPYCNNEEIEEQKVEITIPEFTNYEDLTLEEAYQLENAVCDGDSKTVIVEK